MNNKDAIKRLKEVIEDCTSGEDEPYREAFGMGILALEKQLNGGWISVKDRLPEIKDDSVLVYFKHGSMDMVHIEEYFDDITNGLDENGNQLYTKWYISQGVVAWMPLPEEYEETK